MDAALTEAVESKSYDMLGYLEKRVSQLAADRAELEQAEATAGGDLASAWPVGDRFCLAIRPTDFSFLLYDQIITTKTIDAQSVSYNCSWAQRP